MVKLLSVLQSGVWKQSRAPEHQVSTAVATHVREDTKEGDGGGDEGGGGSFIVQLFGFCLFSFCSCFSNVFNTDTVTIYRIM